MKRFFAQLLSLLVFTFSSAQAETIAELEVTPLRLKLERHLEQQSKWFRLIVKRRSDSNSSKVIVAKVLQLDDPPRLVIDLPDFSSKQNNKILLNDSQLAALRLGSHSDKIRLVFDLLKNSSMEHVINHIPNNKGTIVDFRFNSGDQNYSATSKVRSIRFDLGDTGHPSSLAIEVKNLGMYSISQPKPGLFKIVFHQTRLENSSLAKPLFPSSSDHGFRRATASEEEANAVLEVLVENNVRLSPIIEGDTLRLRAQKIQ